MSIIQDHQASSSVCDDEGCDHKYQNSRPVPSCREEPYKTIIALEDAGLQLGHEFIVFTAPYSRQPLQTAIEEAQKNI
jgi:hypothetical protein